MIVLPLIIFRIREKKVLFQPHEFEAISFYFVFFLLHNFFVHFALIESVLSISVAYSLAHSLKSRRVTGERAAVKTTLSCAYLIDILSFTIKCTNMPYLYIWNIANESAAIAHRESISILPSRFVFALNNYAHIQHSLHLFVGIWHFHSGYFCFALCSLSI